MLGPVSTPTNLYQPVQDSRIQAEAPTSDRLPASTAAEPYAASTATAIAGNLNMMLLSAPERMSQNLVVLTEVLASVLKMKQEPNEPLTTFAARLIEAIATLSPAEQQKLKAMLSDAFAGLQLRTLLQALRNPQGPEAATLAIYLELYRQKDRDPGARAVISSYRQNDEPMSLPAARDPRAGAQPQPLPQPTSSPGGGQPAAALTPGARAMAGALTAASVPPEAASVDADAIYDATAALSQAETTDPAEGANLRVLRQMRERLATATDTTQTPAADGPEPESMVKIGAEPAAASKAERPPGTTIPSAGKTDTGSATPAQTPDAEPAPVETRHPSSHLTAALPAHLLEEVAETELIRALLALYGADDVPDVADIALEALMPPEAEEMEAKRPLPVAAALTEPEADDRPAPSLDRPLHWNEQVALATSTPVLEHRELTRNGAAEGLPLAFVNYVIESEDDAEPARATQKNAQDDDQTEEDEGEEDAAEGDPEEAAEDAQADAERDAPSGLEAEAPSPDLYTSAVDVRTDLGFDAPGLDDVETIPALPSPNEDPAQALYLRLSDFA